MTIKTFYPSALGARQEYSNDNNILGVPDATCATAPCFGGVTKTEDVTTFLDSGGISIADAIPAGSTLNHAYIGLHGSYSVLNVLLAQNAKIRKTGDANVYGATNSPANLTCPALGVSNAEVQIDQFHFVFTMEDYRTQNFACWVEAVNGSAGLATFYCDAVWIRIDYTAPAVAAAGGMGDGLTWVSMLKRLPRLPSFPLKNLFDRWKAKGKLHMPATRGVVKTARCSCRLKKHVYDSSIRTVGRT